MPLSNDLRHLIEYDIFRVKRILHGLVTELPESFEARLLLGDAYLRSLDIEDAIEHYQAALKIDSKSRVAITNLALCGIYTGRYAAALRGFEFLHTSRQDHFALLLAGVLLHRLGRTEEAIERLQKLNATTKNDGALLLVGLQAEVRARRDLGQVRQADQAAERLMQNLAAQGPEAASELYRRFSSYDFHEWSKLADKGYLAAMLAKQALQGRGDLRVPPGFVLPAERAAFAAWAAGQPVGTIYVVKPRGGQGGQGIRLSDRIEDCIDADDAVVQRYIDRPYLVDGRKAHMRIYCLITSVDPLRFYVYDNGIVRFAPQPYQRGPGWLDRSDIHVTNTALHRHHKLLVISQDPMVEDVGHVWSLQAYLRRVAADGHNARAVFRAIARLVGRFVLQVRATGLFERQSAMGSPRSFGAKLFGLDVLLDADAKPWLIEIQRSPAWGGQPLAKRINETVSETIVRMTTSPLVDAQMDARQQAVMAGDPGALMRREEALERAHRGGFVRILHAPSEQRDRTTGASQIVL
jgi:tetratricopeptide (TPR) repeat protein